MSVFLCIFAPPMVYQRNADVRKEAEKDMKQTWIILLAVLLSAGAYAQRSEVFAASDALLKEGVELYQTSQYGASQRVLNEYLESATDPTKRDEATFFSVACAFELRQGYALKQLRAFVKEHPYSPYLSEAYFMLGVLNAERRKFKMALKELDKVKSTELFRQHEDACIFYKGYAHLHMNEPRAALGFFQRLRSKEESLYYLHSRYYYAYSQYALGQYKRALPDFLFCEQTDLYKDIAPYYIVQIYFSQGKYDEVEGRTQEMLANDPENVNNWELFRIMGEISYQKGEYANTIDYLEKYAKAAEKQNAGLVREDLYLLGMSCYKLDRYDEAITYLRKVKSVGDSLTQSTQYHLGNALIKNAAEAERPQAIQQAKSCYAAAMRMDFSAGIKEEAMYNYALCTYQSSTALGESVTAFMDFLEAYPQSKHAEEVFSMLSDAFMQSKNYAAALDALGKIRRKTDKMLLTEQFLRYQIGSDFFLQSKHQDAICWFDSVLIHAQDPTIAPLKENKTYKTEALFMRAESAYRLQNYDLAKQSISEFEQQPNASASQNYALAKYLEGYIDFQKKDYSSAGNAFKAFLKIADEGQPIYADALNRIGDCLFSQRDFVQAEGYYAQVVALGASGADYAMFQRGYALGLLKRYGDKVSVLERLVTTYPRSDYADDGLYEIARAEVQREDNNRAILAYDRLLATYPNSNLARKAALEKAMLYYNDKQYEQAINAYKIVVNNYPTTDEAYAALEGLEICYVETNNVQAYLAYTKTLGKFNMQTATNKEDSLTYTAAELQYMQGNYAQAAAGFMTYLTNYCEGGRYCTNAQYYCADAYYQKGDKANALKQFKRLTEMPANLYMEEALMRTAELYYDASDYANALTYFQRLQTAASTRKNTDIAQLGVLRCAFFLGDNDETIRVATEMLADGSADAATLEEARFNRAKAYAQKGQHDMAIPDFRLLATEVRTAQGAESAYRIAEELFYQGQYADAEQEVMRFVNMNTSQQYWLAKAFILLADIYANQGDDFQAEQYLLSLQANYTIQDDIQTTIQERLSQIQQRNSAHEAEEAAAEEAAEKANEAERAKARAEMEEEDYDD